MAFYSGVLLFLEGNPPPDGTLACMWADKYAEYKHELGLEDVRFEQISLNRITPFWSLILLMFQIYLPVSAI